METIPIFLASNSKTLIIKHVGNEDIQNIKKVLEFYNDHEFEIEESKNEISITKEKRRIEGLRSVSKICVPGFNEDFKVKKVFNPIIIETDKKTNLGENLEILIKSLIINPIQKFENDVDFKTLKHIFSLQGDDNFIMKKEYLESLMEYASQFDAAKYVPSERLKYGPLVGITDFRIGDKLYDIRNKINITKRDFHQLHIYSLMLKKIIGVEIKKLIILSPVNGEEYIMKVKQGGVKDKILELYKDIAYSIDI
jgi:hypothetical protein